MLKQPLLGKSENCNRCITCESSSLENGGSKKQFCVLPAPCLRSSATVLVFDAFCISWSSPTKSETSVTSATSQNCLSESATVFRGVHWGVRSDLFLGCEEHMAKRWEWLNAGTPGQINSLYEMNKKSQHKIKNKGLGRGRILGFNV